ncbi:MAG: cohesin domain-containing protein, partial [Methanosarcinales archaeon]
EITKASEIAGGSVKILFDPNVAEVQGVESGDFGIPIANIDNANGFVFIATSSASAICKENATLAKVVFIGIATGTTTLEITDASLNNESGTLITPTTSNGAIKVVSTTEVKGDFILKQLQMEKLPWNFQVQV